MLLSRLAFGRSGPKRNLWQMKMCNLTFFLEMLKGKMDHCILSIEYSPFSSGCKRMYNIVSRISRTRMTNVEHFKPLTIMAIQSLPGQTRVLERFSTEHSQQFSQSAKYVSYLILLIQHLFPLKTNAFIFFNFFLGSAFFKRIQPELKKKKRISAMPW